MIPAAARIRFVRGDRARLLRVRFRDPAGVPWDFTGMSALFDCRVGDESTSRVFALTDAATADGQVLFLSDGWLEVWLEAAKSILVPAGDYRFGLKILDSLGTPRHWIAGPLLARPRPTGAA